MKNFINYIFVGSFFLLIWSPYFRMNYNPAGQITNTENRTLSHISTFNLKDPIVYINEYEKYFNDHFGFRTNLISWNNYLSVVLINESPISTVVLGSKGWLYYAEGLTDNAKRPIFSEDRLLTIGQTLEQQTKYLNDQGIMLVIVIAPDKHTIYPEMLPFYLKNYANNSELARKLSYLKQFQDIQIVDLMRPLLDKKPERTLYYKTDTHWNNYGSFIVYQELMKVIKIKFPKVEMLNEEDFDITIKPQYEGDLLKILALPFKFTEDEEVRFTLKSESKLKKLPGDKIIPKALISYDSFFDPQYPWGTVNFLANHFSQVIVTTNGLDFDHDLIKEERPDVVIFEIAERSL